MSKSDRLPDLVIFANRFGVPVSTTHVSVGSIFGIGLGSKRLNTGIMQEIILSWLVTLPIAAAFSAGAYWILVLFVH